MGPETRSANPVERARALRKTLTPAEATLWKRLKTWRDHGYQFRRQAPFRGYFLDFACFSRRVVVEADGAHHEVDVEQIEHDRMRDRVLAREGFVVLRFSNFAVRHHLGSILSEIWDALESGPTLAGASRRPVPPHKGEGGPS